MQDLKLRLGERSELIQPILDLQRQSLPIARLDKFIEENPQQRIELIQKLIADQGVGDPYQEPHELLCFR